MVKLFEIYTLDLLFSFDKKLYICLLRLQLLPFKLCLFRCSYNYSRTVFRWEKKITALSLISTGRNIYLQKSSAEEDHRRQATDRELWGDGAYWTRAPGDSTRRTGPPDRPRCYTSRPPNHRPANWTTLLYNQLSTLKGSGLWGESSIYFTYIFSSPYHWPYIIL